MQTGREGLNLLNFTKKEKVISEGQIKICILLVSSPRQDVVPACLDQDPGVSWLRDGFFYN